MRRASLAGGTVVALVVAVAGAAGEATSTLSAGSPVPSFAGYSPSGGVVSLKQVMAPAKERPARVVVVSFFATWCKPCEQGLPVIQGVVNGFKDQDVRGLLVAYGEDGDKVAPFLKQKGLTLPVVLDPYVKISGRFGVDKSLPWTFVVDGGGTIRRIFHVEGAGFEKDLTAAIQAAMK